GAAFLTMADAAAVKKLTGAEVGFAGPVSLPAEVQGIGKVRIIADISIEGISNAVTGANKTDYHLTGVCDARDFKAEKYIDLSSVKKGDVCPKCGKGKLDIVRGIEVGQVFKLGTKYSEALKAVFLDENGKENPMIMGTYGIGIGRTAAAAIEQNNDENGIIWPLPLAPFHVELISVGEDSKVSETAEKIYAELMKNGIEVLFDDRAGRPGVKFADADLIGIPYQAIIGKKAIEQGKIEFKIRKTGERKMVGAKDIIDLINKELH
ncbi:MAG: proline--tRNA ligase, partial [Deltaproteobacteria bacterium]|nr:proline--tRNA ligase [Deltaproteobacteria bacterium]